VLCLLVLSVASCRSPQQEAVPARSASGPTRGGELIASIRSEPATYNRLLPSGGSTATDLFTTLTQARLVRVNRATDDLEPWLAEAWETSDDGLTHTIRLREGVQFADGQPLTSADVLFTFRAVYDPAVGSPLASNLLVHGRPLDVSAPDPRTVVIRFPEPFAPGLRLLDSLPILPRHALEPALASGTFAKAWGASTPPGEIVGLGPFRLVEHVAGQRLVFERNPRYFRRDQAGVQLPYLDRLIVTIVPDQSSEALRLEATETDLMTNGDIRSQDYAAFKRLADEGKLRLIDVGVGLEPDFLSFNLRPAALARLPWLSKREVRQAISCAVDRQAIVNTIYLGAGAPLFGAVTPGNKRWFAPPTARCSTPNGDRAQARQLLTAAGLTDRNGDGMLEYGNGTPVRFAVLTQANHQRERVATVLQEQLRQIGIAVDIVPLDPGGLFQRWKAGDFDAIYFGLQASSTDPALNPDFWLSSGPFHFWNPSQKVPATEWEQKIDQLMRTVSTVSDLAQRQQAFAEVQRILQDEMPSIYVVAPRVTLATSPRVVNPTPVLQAPHLLWSADTLASSR
jgi:peptide/nickel transport system substrate-binding protein